MTRSDLFEKMFWSIFDPKENERILLLYDVPTSHLNDNHEWMERRHLIDTWLNLCSKLSRKREFSVEKMGIAANDEMDPTLSNDIKKYLTKYNIIIAMTEYSMTSSLVLLVKNNQKSMRCASMPYAEKRMMDTVFSMDYSDVKHYAHKIKNLLEEAENAHIEFSTGDTLDIDLRNRHAGADDGDCTFPGAFINLPSGEGFIAPYEGVDEELTLFGKSKTKGVIPLYFDDHLIRCEIEENRIVELEGHKKVKSTLNTFLDCFNHRRNIAELGIGCNPHARVTGNIIEDEKVGVHIAYGTSSHLGGRITSDLHQDIVYAKGCPISADSVQLSFTNRKPFDLVKDAEVQYHILC